MWDASVQSIAGWVQAQTRLTRQAQGNATWQVHGGERSHATGAAKGIANKNTKPPPYTYTYTVQETGLLHVEAKPLCEHDIG